MTCLTKIICPYCERSWVHDSNVNDVYLMFNSNIQCRCWKCQKIYFYSVVKLEITNEIVQAPFCHTCNMPMQVQLTHGREESGNHMFEYDFYEWVCSMPHTHINTPKQSIFIGMKTITLPLPPKPVIPIDTPKGIIEPFRIDYSS